MFIEITKIRKNITNCLIKIIDATLLRKVLHIQSIFE